MSRKFKSGIYYPKNPQKFIGQAPPNFRSGWEFRVFCWLDQSSDVISWASESVKIPYQHPLDGLIHNYIPDLLVKYKDKSGKEIVELIEIKPKRETLMEYAKSKKDQINLAINLAKWDSAAKWAKQHNISFRIMNEDSIFGVK